MLRSFAPAVVLMFQDFSDEAMRRLMFDMDPDSDAKGPMYFVSCRPQLHRMCFRVGVRELLVFNSHFLTELVCAWLCLRLCLGGSLASHE